MSNKDLKVSYFDTVFKYSKDVPINEVFSIISNGQLKELTEKIKSEPDKELRNKLKMQLPAITVSGTFKGTHKIKDFKEYSGLIQIDFDDLFSIDAIKLQLMSDVYTYCCFVSPSGTGLKLIVKVAPDYNKHLKSFLELQKYYNKTYNLQIDEKCKDISRLMFLCSDTNIFINGHSKVFEVLEKTQTESKPKEKQQYNNDTVADVEKVINQIKQTRIDITANYNDWLSCGYAFADEFGESGRSYFHSVSQFYQKYEKTNTDNQFNECLKSKKNNGISPFFALAKKFNIDTVSVQKNEPKPKETSKKEQKTEYYENKQKHDFYTIEQDSSGKYKGIKINKVKLIDMLKSFGFFRYDIDTNTIKFVLIKNNTIKEVSKNFIADTFDKYISELKPYKHRLLSKEGNSFQIMTSKEIKEKFYDNLDRLFSDNLLNRLTPEKKIEIQKDSKTSKYFFYKNGVVEVSKNGIDLKKYSELKYYVWADQILNREFKINSDVGNWQKFFENICNKDVNRIQSLKTIIGYLLHNYMDRKLFAMILTDSKISENNEANGRSGKTLFMQSLGKMLNSNDQSTIYVEINGKDIKVDKHKYDKANIDTQTLHQNDVQKKFDIEIMFNDITECITVDKKNQKPFSIRIKICITTNQTIKIEGASAKDRVKIFEFSDYYSENLSPDKEFNQWFFTDWDSAEWNKFDTFILNCCIEYFKNDCEVIEPNTITLHRRTLIEHTNYDFVKFLDKYAIGNPDENEPPKFVIGEKNDKNIMFLDFINEYPDFKDLKQNTFSIWLKRYFNKMNVEFKEFASNGKHYVLILN